MVLPVAPFDQVTFVPVAVSVTVDPSHTSVTEMVPDPVPPVPEFGSGIVITVPPVVVTTGAAGKASEVTSITSETAEVVPQPVELDVAVYEPAALTVILLPVWPFDQTTLLPVAVKVTVAEPTKAVVPEAVIIGAVALFTMVTELEAEEVPLILSEVAV